MLDIENTQLTEKKELLLDLLLAEEGWQPEKATLIPGHTDYHAVPLTPAQYRIWFIEQAFPGDHSLLIPTAIRLRFGVRRELLTQAIHYLWQRHECLRATFFVEKEQVWQKVGDFPPPRVEFIDLRSLKAADQEKAVQFHVQNEGRRPFNLQQDCLFRVKLLCLPEEEAVFLMTVHHIIADGWSVQLLLRELIQVYLSFLDGRQPALPALKVNYFDYAWWQEERIASDEVQRQLAYWREHLPEEIAGMELPADFARPALQTFTGAHCRYSLPKTLYRDLVTLSRQNGVSLYMTLLAAFKLLVYRHTGQHEITIGTPVSGRLRPELEGVVGLFVNSLVLHANMEEVDSFQTWLAQVREVCLAAFANQEVPFELLIRELLPIRDPGRTPFFQIYFNMLDFELSFPVPELDADYITPPPQHANFDLTLYVERGQNDIHLTLVYNKMLFQPERMADLLRQYHLLLQQVVAAPEQSPAGYSLLTDQAWSVLPDPRRVLSEAWRGPVFARLDEWAGKHPARPAVSDPIGQWTYQELADNSNRIAHHLLEHGIGTGALVAIYARHSAALVTAIIGVLKSGATVLMLDPRNPPARLQQMIAAADPAGLITFTGTSNPLLFPDDLWPSFSHRLALPATPEAIAAQLAGYTPHPPAIPIQPDHTAFLTFTSGTTGIPKGVVCLHRSLTHFTPWMAEKFQLSSTDRFSMLSGIAHDPLQREIFTPLWLGAEIHIPDPSLMWQPDYLVPWFHSHQITILHLIPSMVYAMSLTNVAGAATVADAHLRYAFFVGEPLRQHIVDKIRTIFNEVEIVNLYGSVETQRATSYEIVQPKEANAPVPKPEIPLGVGMPGAQLLVLTPALTSAGIGELGELYMRSPHLAQGYWQDEAETARRFLPDTGQGDSLTRLFRTGDFGRYLPDGRVEYAGRQDRQVNVRGFRVELSEIETALTALPAVMSTIVVAAKQPAGDVIFVAYIVPKDRKNRPEVKSLRHNLQTRIPDYMVPSAFIFLPAIPLTPNGKVNYRALPPPKLEEHKEDQYTAPRDEIEETLVAIWQDLLPSARIGILQDFFALGGHSILAIQMFSRLSNALHMEFNVNLLYQYSTVAELADVARSRRARQRESSLLFPQIDKNLICIQQGRPGEPIFFCAHGAGGDVLYMHSWKPYFKQWSLYGFEASGVDGLSWSQDSIAELAATYIRQMKIIQPHGPYFLGGYSGGGVLAYEIAQQLRKENLRTTLLVFIDTYHPDTRPLPYRWPRRMRRVVRSPIKVLLGVFERMIITPLLARYLKLRYVQRNQRVPMKFRNTLLANEFVSAKQEYRPEPYPGRTLLIRSLEVDPIYTHIDHALGWGNLIENLEIAAVPGNHFTVVLEPYIGNLAEELKKAWYSGTSTSRTDQEI